MGDNDFHYVLFEVISINSVIFLNTCEAYGVVLVFFLSDFWTSEDTPIWRPNISLNWFLHQNFETKAEDVDVDLISVVAPTMNINSHFRLLHLMLKPWRK